MSFFFLEDFFFLRCCLNVEFLFNGALYNIEVFIIGYVDMSEYTYHFPSTIQTLEKLLAKVFSFFTYLFRPYSIFCFTKNNTNTNNYFHTLVKVCIVLFTYLPVPTVITHSVLYLLFIIEPLFSANVTFYLTF